MIHFSLNFNLFFMDCHKHVKSAYILDWEILISIIFFLSIFFLQQKLNPVIREMYNYGLN